MRCGKLYYFQQKKYKVSFQASVCFGGGGIYYLIILFYRALSYVLSSHFLMNQEKRLYFGKFEGNILYLKGVLY